MKESSKLFLFRPHIGPWFSIPFKKAIKKKRVAVKYKYILDVENVRYLAFIKEWSLANFRGNAKEILHLLLWCLYYFRNPFKISFSVKCLDSVFFFYHGNCSNTANGFDKNLVDYLSRIRCRKICHLTHFQYGLENGLKNLELIKPDILVGESNPLKKIKILKNKSYSDRFRLLPFVIEDRFFENDFHSQRRINQILLSGTIAPPITDEIFISLYGTDCLQPERLMLNDFAKNKKFYKNIISNNYSESEKKIDAQEEYFKLDIAKMYSKYKFSIVTQEIVGFPAIGMFEAMASGCIIVCNDEELMGLYGLIPDVHYIFTIKYIDSERIIASYSHAVLKRIQSNSLKAAHNYSKSSVIKEFKKIISA